MRTVLFRADGNATIGQGHISRCLALAESLSESHVRKVITRASTTVLGSLHAGFDEVSIIPEDTSPEDEASYIAQTHLSETDICVTDGYHFTTGYQADLKASGCTLVCVDDIHTCHFVADAVINHADGVTPGDYSAEPHTRFFLGMKYAMLRGPFLEAISREKIFAPQVEMLIFMGGAGSGALNDKMVKVATAVQGVDTVNMVIGGAPPNYEQWPEAEGRDNFKVLGGLSADEMVALISRSHLVVCPASTISLEVVAVNAGLVTGLTADNQSSILEGLKAAEVCRDVGNFATASATAITEVIQQALEAEELRRMIDNQKNVFESDPRSLHREVFRSL